MLPGLAEHFEVIAFDRRTPHTQGSVEEDGDDLSALVEALDRAPAHVVTNSYGGNVALRLPLGRSEPFRSPTCHEPPLWSLLGDDPENAAMREQGARTLRAVAQRLASGDHDCAGDLAPVVERRRRRGAGTRAHRASRAVPGGDPRRVGPLRRRAHQPEGRPSPLLGALLATRYRAELRFRQPPNAVQRLVFPRFAALARRRGLERTIDRYLDLETHPAAQAGLGRLPERVMTRAPHRG